MSHLRPTAVLAALVSTLALVACADDGTSSESSDVKDSFAKPTAHGELRFGEDADASFSASERFHAWTFTLDGDAAIDLETVDLATNLDTVAYLYRREPGTSAWGAYVAKNDDKSRDELGSAIEGDFEAGEYLLKIKAAKEAMRGGFTVRAACDGEGCPAAEACDEDADATLPDGGSYAPSCAEDVAAIVLTEVTRDRSDEASLDATCEAGVLGAKALDYYVSYWVDVVGWSELVEENPELSFRVLEHGDVGTTVEVDAGGDEDRVTFVFDAGGDLLAYYHDEQSPTSGWNCADDGEDEVDAPADDCLGKALRLAPKSAPASDGGTTTPAGAATAMGWASAAVDAFAASQDLGPNDQLSFTIATWTSVDGENVADVTLSRADVVVRTVLLDDYATFAVFRAEGDGEALSLVCDEL